MAGRGRKRKFPENYEFPAFDSSDSDQDLEVLLQNVRNKNPRVAFREGGAAAQEQVSENDSPLQNDVPHDDEIVVHDVLEDDDVDLVSDVAGDDDDYDDVVHDVLEDDDLDLVIEVADEDEDYADVVHDVLEDGLGPEAAEEEEIVENVVVQGNAQHLLVANVNVDEVAPADNDNNAEEVDGNVVNILQGLFDANLDDGEDDGLSEESEDEEFIEMDDYKTILDFLSKEWIKIELTHQVSKVASNAFWSMAKNWFPRLFHAKEMQNIHRKTPNFAHIRRKMYKENVPPIHLEFCFKHKESGVLTIVKDSSITPKTRFPPNEYQKLWEVAYVKVLVSISFLVQKKFLFCYKRCFQFQSTKSVTYTMLNKLRTQV